MHLSSLTIVTIRFSSAANVLAVDHVLGVVLGFMDILGNCAHFLLSSSLHSLGRQINQLSGLNAKKIN